MSNQTAQRSYSDWIFINRNGTVYDMPADGLPRCCYGKDRYGFWYWFKKSGEDYWFINETKVPSRIKMAAMLME